MVSPFTAQKTESEKSLIAARPEKKYAKQDQPKRLSKSKETKAVHVKTQVSCKKSNKAYRTNCASDGADNSCIFLLS